MVSRTSRKVIFHHFDNSKYSDFNYSDAAFGFYTDPGVGGQNDSGDDWLHLIPSLILFMLTMETEKVFRINWITGLIWI